MKPVHELRKKFRQRPSLSKKSNEFINNTTLPGPRLEPNSECHVGQFLLSSIRPEISQSTDVSEQQTQTWNTLGRLLIFEFMYTVMMFMYTTMISKEELGR